MMLAPVFTTSYMQYGVNHLITSFVEAVAPKLVVEIGAQQGHSAVLICRGMTVDANFATFDLFSETYSQPPFAQTHR